MSAHLAPAAWPRRLLVALGVVALLALSTLLFAWNRAAPETAQAAGPGPGMSLAAPTTVFEGLPFTVTISTAPAPDVEIEGFATEVLFPDELKWLQRPNCLGPGPDGEVQVERQDGGPIALCQSFISVLLGGLTHAVLSEFTAPPLEPLNVTPGSTTTLVELDFVCNTAGTYKLTLTAYPDSGFGSVYADTLANTVLLKTVPQDYDGDTVPNQVADTLAINCVSGPVPSPTPTALPLTPTPTATPTPCPPAGCPTPTPPPCPLTPSGSPLPGMSLEAPATVFAGVPFTLCVNADPAPDIDIVGFAAEVLYGRFPELSECDNRFDNDGDAIVNDGCPKVGAAPEEGRFCDNTTDDDSDGFVNDGCPRFGVISEFNQCAGNQDDDGDGFVNDGCLQQGGTAETGAQCANTTNDDFLDDLFANDGCPAVGDPEVDECGNADNDDPGDDPFVNDGCPAFAVAEAGACDGTVDDDSDGAPNDGCSQVGPTGEAGSFCADMVDDDGDTVVNDGCPPAGSPETGAQCDNTVDDDGDGRPNDGCPMAGGLKWLQRASCEDEVQVAQKNGDGLSLCNSFDTIVFGGAGFEVLSQFTSPAANLNLASNTTTLLVELDFVCNIASSHRLTLTAAPDSPEGAVYFRTNGKSVSVKTVPEELDLNFDGVPETHQVADTLVISCVTPFDFNGTPIAVGGFQTALRPPDAPEGGSHLTVALATAVAAVALGLGGAAWYTRRRARERSRG